MKREPRQKKSNFRLTFIQWIRSHILQAWHKKLNFKTHSKIWTEVSDATTKLFDQLQTVSYKVASRYLQLYYKPTQFI